MKTQTVRKKKLIPQVNNKPRKFDKITLFGDEAAYFTVNTNPDRPTVLYSHNEACKDFNRGDVLYKQLLCKVITGIEADYSDKIRDSLKDLKNLDAMIEDGKTNKIRYPIFPGGNDPNKLMPD